MKKINVTAGDKYGRLTVIREILKKGYNRKIEVKCDCGRLRAVWLNDVRSGKTTSCGCYRNERVAESITTHGMSSTVEYHAWWDMIKRCTDKTHPSYDLYGGRGITVCDRWLGSVLEFVKDVGMRPVDANCVDRIDNMSGYYPGNVRWVTVQTNNQNMRTSKYWIVGKKKYSSLTEAAFGENVSEKTIRMWCNGWLNYRTGKIYPRKKDCYSEFKYANQ